MADTMQQWVDAMRAGRFGTAWAMTERALRTRDPLTRDDPTLPYHLRWVWDGRSLDGRHVLVRCYHGLGDTIQFARYLPALAERAASVTVEVQPELIGLLGQIPDVRLVPFDHAHPLPPSECDIEVMELAFALRLPPQAVAPPYLTARPDPAAAGRIGICSLSGAWDMDRRVPPDQLAGICRNHPCLTLAPERCELPVDNPDGCSSDIRQSARLISGLALVITVDTMVAHLAGALGAPTWLLLKADPDWRWPLEGDSLWYPSVRSYRQQRAGDWAAVITRVEADLAEIRSEIAQPGAFVQRQQPHVAAVDAQAGQRR